MQIFIARVAGDCLLNQRDVIFVNSPQMHITMGKIFYYGCFVRDGLENFFVGFRRAFIISSKFITARNSAQDLQIVGVHLKGVNENAQRCQIVILLV
ncbi:MAG: hypothetical protein BWY12_02627 [candidate division BRC1 bacterium ADurb.Bin183]|nr:MAG: hypothetical protein BWY12_02627 [candidate division BRC1 bacterium ADurb.Bin183]